MTEGKRTRAEERIAEIDASPAALAEQIEQLREQLLVAEREALLVKLLNVADDFDRAIGQLPAELSDEPWVEGVVAIDRKLRAVLESEGLSAIDAVSQPFDPQIHEAVAQEPTDQVPEGTVTSEFQRGYMLRDRVLRPALVAVAKASADGAGQGMTDNQRHSSPADAGTTED